MTAIKFSTTPVNGSIKSNNIVIGNDNIAYGPTSSTGFYAGIAPPDSGYTIYNVNQATHIPTAVVAHNDTELIYYAKSFGGTNIVTTSDAINYLLTGSTGTTVVNMDYHGIVTSGLVVNLDAGFIPSYPKNGTVWRDLTGNYNATILSGVSFNNNGEFIFNGTGTSDYRIDCGTNFSPYLSGNTDFSIECMVYCDLPQTNMGDIWGNHNTFNGIVLQQYGGGSINVYYWAYGDGAQWVFGNSNSYSGLAFPDQVYSHITIIYKAAISGFTYINGELIDVAKLISNSGMTPNSLFNFQLGIGFQPASGRNFKGKISEFRIYNRALSSSEILQNFNALKYRYLVKDGLALYLDAGRVESYSGIGTQWNDISSNNQNGTISGATYNSNGYLSFDGNDFIKSNQTIQSVGLYGSASIETWIYSTSTANSVIFCMGIDGIEFNTGMVISNNNLYARNTTGDRIITGSTFSQNTWVHLVLVYKSDGAYGYVNGSFAGYNSLAYATTCSTYYWSIGVRAYDNVSTQFFYGNIGYLRYYLSKELSLTEIKQNYQLTKSRFGL